MAYCRGSRSQPVARGLRVFLCLLLCFSLNLLLFRGMGGPQVRLPWLPISQDSYVWYVCVCVHVRACDVHICEGTPIFIYLIFLFCLTPTAITTKDKGGALLSRFGSFIFQ